MQEYENDRWRIISAKVGSGFSAVACKEKADELEAGSDIEEVEGHEEGYEQEEADTMSLTNTQIPL